MFNSFVRSLMCGALLVGSTSALAAWQVDNNHSRVNFVSVKNNAIAENHFFKDVSGSVDESGMFKLAIDLNSVETQIPIRNERMQKFLFNTVEFPAMEVTANVSELIAQAKDTGVAQGNVQAQLALHGKTKAQQMAVSVVASRAGDLVVSSMMPVLVSPADFALQPGIDKLKSLAGLDSITRAVPVSFVLTLNEQ
ncbi:YceI family protein [Pseudoalteromonas ruthenica]|uniref:YceI family protein n=1 Tax=Pseudoalteromonas ruthenica TaxID=151081 RepID=UPI0020168754|nr:YceI family protein [Pseudoalteromonas ruthenica]